MKMEYKFYLSEYNVMVNNLCLTEANQRLANKMEKILDEVEKDYQGKLFSKLSFTFAILSITLIAFLVMFIPSKIKAEEFIETPIFTPILLLLTTILGLIFSGLSIRKKEKLRYLKPLGIGLNVLVAIIVFGSILFSKIMDYLREIG